jgi:nitrite reductase/ring-hydroxylating ferredoxin subunit
MATEFKIKNLSALDLKPGEKREVEVEGIEDGKVLLLNVGGKTTAVGTKCTHYGKLGTLLRSQLASANTRTRCSTCQGSFIRRWQNNVPVAWRLVMSNSVSGIFIEMLY